MRKTVVIGLLAFILLAGCRASSTTPAGDAGLTEEEQALQGSWAAVYAERGGHTLSPERVRKIRVIIEGATLRFIEGPDGEVAGFEIDPNQDPKAIDIVIEKGPDRGKWAPGIYLVEGDTLQICWAEPGRPRPVEFTTENGAAGEYLKLRRER